MGPSGAPGDRPGLINNGDVLCAQSLRYQDLFRRFRVMPLKFLSAPCQNLWDDINSVSELLRDVTLITYLIKSVSLDRE